MKDLETILRELIANDGPIPLSDYMRLCLLHPEHGYYATHDPLGAAGDFVTAPEISQMFGELIGLALAQAWLDQGAPKPFTLAELGPGRGTLMADALRATRAVPGFHDAAQVHMVEVSSTLRGCQQQALKNHRVAWVASADALPDQPLFLVANEFFDALPIRQYVRCDDSWRERRVGLKDDALTFGLAPPAPLTALDDRLEDTRDGDLVEHCPSAAPILQAIGGRIAEHGGGALIIDYGDWRSLGDTFQALRAHERTNPLETPGKSDLTAHVDFAALAQAAPCAHSRLTPQGVFLERLGITQRAQALARNLTGEALETHIAAHRRLTHGAEMGTLFKVMGLYPEGAAPPPGLEP
ncbi:class I SAM-dependent methyltransferase [Marimonas arenosa]|uniref:SAM-dependent methyltransferase n=1 Tax=Marimonas arenosa TaxID=1795305 RepID=A0AAE4B690_9RHOB|nr:SAM-dependent methyltransferase [Marimonas arenosa]MDQ2090111.1 SAM-dependent methyltransferase [Marimonas arenosa]